MAKVIKKKSTSGKVDIFSKEYREEKRRLMAKRRKKGEEKPDYGSGRTYLIHDIPDH